MPTTWNMWWRRRAERKLEEEVRAHLALEAEERMEAGETPAQAALRARRAFGSIAGISEQTRESWGWTALARAFDDLRYGIRMLRKTPGWTAVMAGTLALGIGLTTAIFSLVYSVLLQPLPYPAPDRLVALWTTTSSSTMSRINVNAASWLHWREQARSFEDISLTRAIANFNLTGDGAPERLQGARTSWNLPNVLGISPLLGRTFTEEEQRRDARVALLSFRLWQRRFGGDPGVLGRRIQLNGAPFEVIGVMPPSFRYPDGNFELWTPLYIPPAEIHERLGYDFISVGRLKPGVTLPRAQAEISAIMRRLDEQYGGGANRDWSGSHGWFWNHCSRARSVRFALPCISCWRR